MWARESTLGLQGAPKSPEQQRSFASLEKFLREYKLNLAHKVTKIHPVQQANKGTPIHEKQEITDGITEKKPG